MKMQVSLGSTLLGGALATIATSIAKHIWQVEISQDVQAAVQTVFVTLVVGIAKLIEAILAKYKINLDDNEQQNGDGK